MQGQEPERSQLRLSPPPPQGLTETDFEASNQNPADCGHSAMKIQIRLKSFIAIINL